MKTKLLLPILSGLFLASFLYPGNAQTADDFNQGLTATSPSPDVVKISWWGSESSLYQVHVTDDLDSLQWTALPELFPGTDAPIELNFTITGANGERMFYRVMKLPLPPLITEDPKMVIHKIRYIGNEAMRTVFSDGLDFLPNDPDNFFDSGMVFSTGIAADWNVTKTQNAEQFLPGDPDLNHWMLNAGFGWPPTAVSKTDSFLTRDAAGIEIDFQVDPSVETGKISLSYIFASDEYYMPPSGNAQNDAMAIFIAELDSSGEPILDTQVNVGVLAETETYSRAMNIFNVGDLQKHLPPPDNEFNIDQSAYVNNSPDPAHHGSEVQNPPPYDFGYSGFTSRLVASGGIARVDGDIDARTRVRQINVEGLDDPSSTVETAWGGILFRGRNRKDDPLSPSSNRLTGYVVSFGVKSGDPELTLYKLEDLNVNSDFAFLRPNPNTVPSGVEVLASEPIANFDFDAWYWIRVKAEGNLIRAKIWKGQTEPGEWTIEHTDSTDPIESGFLGLISPHSPPGPEDELNDNRWDEFKVLGPEGETVDFSGNEPGKFTPLGWSTVGYGRNASEWEVVEDPGSTGGRHLRHRDDQVSLSVLKYERPGTLEGGKSYRLKIVVADTRDRIFDSALLIESGSVQVIPE